jgi:hypothetical protein
VTLEGAECRLETVSKLDFIQRGLVSYEGTLVCASSYTRLLKVVVDLSNIEKVPAIDIKWFQNIRMWLKRMDQAELRR